jgi:hypothetical protein
MKFIICKFCGAKRKMKDDKIVKDSPDNKKYKSSCVKCRGWFGD